MSTGNDILYKLLIANEGVSLHKGDAFVKVDSKSYFALGNASKTKILVENLELEISLYKVDFHRKMYEPGHIEAVILIQFTITSAESFSMETIKRLFFKRLAALSVNTNGTIVAKNYYVHSLHPELSVSTATKDGIEYKSYDIYTRLDIFSLDKLLTLNKFSQAYLGKKLVEDIVAPALVKFSVSYSYIGNFGSLKIPISSDRFFPTMAADRTLKHLSADSAELVQPYLVQYNESLYDFAARVANRCGESMYFEDGVLCFGLASKSAASIGNVTVMYSVVTGGPLSVSDYSRDTVKTDAQTKLGKNDYNADNNFKPKEYNSEAVARGSDGFPSDAFSTGAYTYNSELAAEDHYIVLYKDKFAAPVGATLWWDNPEAKGMELVASALNAKNLIEVLIDYGMQTAESGSAYSKRKKKVTEEGNETINENIRAAQDYAVLFSDKGTHTFSHWITRKYYADIKSNQEACMRKMVCLDLKDTFQDIKLGDIITLAAEKNATQYMVVQIEMASKEKSAGDFEENNGQQVETPPPSMRVYAVPATGGSFYPPLLPGDLFRKSGPQPAFVIDSDDPKGQGRVRVRFAWQSQQHPENADGVNVPQTKKELDKLEDAMLSKRSKLESHSKGSVYFYPIEELDDTTQKQKVVVVATKKDKSSDGDFNTAKDNYSSACVDYWDKKKTYDSYVRKYWEDSTPWIRMVTPMATGGGGMYFQPEIGDEVMVDFENGNIDRPFVSGLLYSKNAVAPIGSNRIIMSRNGHSIKFYDPDDTNLFVAGTYPGLKFLKSFGVAADDWGEDYHKAIGGIELADKLGFYRISMSSHNRNISISSPLGDVCMDAFTGITIKAPNGNVRIEGKNVDIIANNNLTLQSGENIYNGLLEQSGAAAAIRILIKTTIKDTVGNFFDLSLLRTLLEVVIRPVDGTLRIKSRRYLLLEAGDGKAAIEYDKYQSNRLRPWAARSAQKAQANQLQNIATAQTTAGTVVQMQLLFQEIRARLHGYVLAFVPCFNAVKDAFDSLNDQSMFYGQPNAATYALQDSAANNATTTPDDVLKYAFGHINQDPTGNNPLIAQFPVDPTAGGNFAQTCPPVLNAVATKVWQLKALTGKYESCLDETLGRYPLFKDAVVSQLNLKNNNVLAVLGGNHPANAVNEFYYWIDQINTNAANTPQNIFAASLQVATFFDWERISTRKAAFGVISEAANTNGAIFAQALSNCGFVLKPYPQNNPPANSQNPVSDSDWPKFIDSIEMQEILVNRALQAFPASPNNIPGVKEGALGVLDQVQEYGGHWLEWMVWKDSSHGEILFSNKDNVSYRFNANGVTERLDISFPTEAHTIAQGLQEALRKM